VPYPLLARCSSYFVLTLFLCLVSSAQANDDKDDQFENTIQVSGTGRVSVTPDKADLNLSVEVQAKTAQSARNQAATAMTALIKAVRNQGVADKDIQTRYVSLYPLYAPDTANKISGYHLTNQVTVIVRDIGKISDIIDDAVMAGGNAARVQGINLAIDQPDIALSKAREKAFADARAKAEQYAGLANVKLGRVMLISEGGGMPPIPVPFAAMSSMRSKEAADATPVQVGEQEVSVTVNVVFAIKN
jgi:uncharacterized protein YggE